MKWPNRKIWYPDDWILPGEFSFDPSGLEDSLRVGPLSWNQHAQKQTLKGEQLQRYSLESEAAHLFRNLLAQERRMRGLPPIFWCVNKPHDKMSPEDWDKWMQQFPLYNVDYPKEPRWASLQ